MTDYVLDGRYALIERIATGGMGEVWRGADQILGRPVAIKMLAAMHADDEQFRARFRAEARYASSLSHPGITRVFDYGESSPLGGPYLIMELVDGQPLSEILERYGTLDPYVVLDIVAQAARALDAAHQADIVHRDIKPGNLLIMADGTTKITDFGIAKMHSPQALNLTATGIVMGTALYVSPEQATGSPLTGSSDIYSLGVVAYECLAGEPPFVADQPLAIAIMHKHEPVPPLPAEVPPQVAELVYAMLAKTPDGRPESARHVADRAEVIREARQRSGYTGPLTSSLPVVPNFPSGPHDFYQNEAELVPASRRPGRPGPRSLLLAAIGVAACSVLAIVAIVLSSGNGAAQLSGTTPTTSGPGGAVATISGKGTATGSGDPGTNLGTDPGTATSSSSKSPSAKRTGKGKGKSTPTSTQSTPTPTVSPTASAIISIIPTSPSSSLPVGPPTVAPTTVGPTTVAPTTVAPTTVPPTTASPTANDVSPTASPTDSSSTGD